MILRDDKLKRTPEKIMERGDRKTKNGTIFYMPKGIRSRTLKILCHFNYKLAFIHTTPDLLEQPKECVEYIMRYTGFSRRTAYDYYNALLYINHLPRAVTMAVEDMMEKAALAEAKNIKNISKSSN